MNDLQYLKTLIFLIISTVFLSVPASAQNANFPMPKQNDLLNGLNLLVWNDTTADKISIKIRINAGAAFDPKDKMGTMALLADSFFPTKQAKEYFADELDGNLEVSSNYDYLEVFAQAKTSDFPAMIETLSNAIINSQITPENFKLIQQDRLNRISGLAKDQNYLGSLAVSERLFGSFPYGKSAEGTSQSVSKIERVDLLLAREKFLSPDNATITIVGNIRPESAYRYVRQLFGAWSKSDRKIPATFRQPDAINKEQTVIDVPEAKESIIFQGTRGVSRNSKDYFASQIVKDALSKRLAKIGAENNVQTFTIANSYLLNGTMIFGAKLPLDKISDFTNKAHSSGFIDPLSEPEFQQSKNAVIAYWTRQLNNKATNADFWRDVDTYNLQSVADQYSDLQKTTLEHANEFLQRLLTSPFVEVQTGSNKKLTMSAN